MIRKMKLEDYEEVQKLFYEVHNLHLKNRPDIYIDGNPLPLKYFEELLNDKENLNYVYILDNSPYFDPQTAYQAACTEK